MGSRERRGGEQGAEGKEVILILPLPLARTAPVPLPMPNSQLHTNILKEFGYLVHQFGIS
ncbi:hypothetical protein [Nostoc sp.]|uniref:hypothetical protein n=1 Tax=Nostoc sp. TaxID=1180 RepID=UPI002FF6270A